MTQVIAELTRLHIDARTCLIAATFLSLVFGLFGTWSFWRSRRLLAALPLVEDRLSVLTNSVSLLTDTTEACFKAMAIQLETMKREAAGPSARRFAAQGRATAGGAKGRQRRIVGAARRGDSLSEIAAREGVAEGEVALRLQVPAQQEKTRPYGDLLS